MTPRDALYVVLIVLPVVDLFASVVLWRAVRDSGGWRRAPGSLKDRATAATLIWLAASLVATIALLGLVHIEAPRVVLLTLLTLAVLIPSMTSVLWVIRWWTGGFGR